LYELDAQGVRDEELIDAVGYALYSRCISILHVSDAMQGNVHCPQCDTIIHHQASDPTAMLQCPTCSWETQWGEYHHTYRTQELGAIGAADMLQDYVANWERVRTPGDKMLLIDQLIHRWHWETQRERPKSGLGRPTAVNLIEGNRQQVLALLDSLTYGAESTTTIQTTKKTWRTHWQEVQARQAAGRQALRAVRRGRREGKHS